MIHQLPFAKVHFEAVDAERELWMLGFEDCVVRQRGGSQQLVPTGMNVQVGPLSREVALGIARGMLRELTLVESNGSELSL